MKKLPFFGLLLWAACQSPAPQPATTPNAQPTPAATPMPVPAGPLVTAVTANGTIQLSDGSEQAIPHFNDPSYFVLYLVRHAEKASDGGNDPDLTADGQARAKRLGAILDNTRIDKVAFTKTKRTLQTANPVRQAAGDPNYDNFPAEFSEDWLQETLPGAAGRKMVYVGHSNTVPLLLNFLTNSKRYADIPDNDFGRFYVAVTKGTGQTEVLELRY